MALSKIESGLIADNSVIGGTTATINGVTPQASNLQPFNRIINGAMTVDQRNAGASVTAVNGGYFLDRWQQILTQTSKYSVQQNAGAVTPPAGFTNYLGITSLSSYSVVDADFFQVKQVIEANNVDDLAWGTANAQDVTLSFWVRSSLTGNFGVVLSWGGATANNRSYPVLYNIAVANTWEKKTITIAGDTYIGTFGTGGYGFQVRFSLGGGATNAGTSGAWATANSQSVTGETSVVGTNGATFYITGVQLEAGSTASSFAHEFVGDTLRKCQRYYQLNLAGAGWSGSTVTLTGAAIGYQTTMRTAPTAALVNGTGAVLDGGVALRDLSAITVYDATNIGGYLYGSLSTTTNNKPHILRQGRVSFSAEL